ncbi:MULTISPECIES: 3-hydroxyacyl-CoA dehydrogenase family protein [Metabacillus]|uniref:3-hydroxyacyl-CoA dehydrogenase family protein n=1 Tax=Metabacillus endolithicus TaxID=1535204 RepID=A0ABW5BU73_9BACI|nr:MULTISPECIES: 3-hydroxyacyl-CoA dehydrogenase family protein [Metabacillus]UGB32401.1 3-hydroxyacyl-CoA dehydrogenase family protein [Metabacillus sp. B2-18]UPG63027.1 3-hydroxyacyl-CoA dehydrogenase family protein [Metabacillus endolithicus]
MLKNQVRSICVVGAGQMGHQIAMLSALAGFETVIQDVNVDALQKAESTLHTIMDKWVAKGKISIETKEQAFQRLIFSTDLLDSVQDADFIIEAIVEKLDAKQELFRKLDEYAKPEAILASNSSTIVNSLLADVTNRPDKVVNMHFFFPPLVMDCVEVVKSEETSELTAHMTMFVCEKMNRTAVLLQKEISGFIANRILGALQREAVYLYENGYADFKDIDLICKKALSHPIGPFELMDLSGIDVGYFVMQQRFSETGDPADRPAACIEEKVKQGHLGRKTGKGWYEYKKEEVRG